mmetsp:Transcript_10242/g.21562  ORF Transcript_10242/g.21562 Transcript_10242/m.21562 type:complete len:94 (-) Transcript_10242:82-363(-)
MCHDIYDISSTQRCGLCFFAVSELSNLFKKRRPFPRFDSYFLLRWSMEGPSDALYQVFKHIFDCAALCQNCFTVMSILEPWLRGHCCIQRMTN